MITTILTLHIDYDHSGIASMITTVLTLHIAHDHSGIALIIRPMTMLTLHFDCEHSETLNVGWRLRRCSSRIQFRGTVRLCGLGRGQ